MENAALVIAYTTQEELSKRYLCLPSLREIFGFIVSPFRRFLWFFERTFTRKEIIQEAEYSRIYTLTEKGLERIDEMPKQICLFISQKEQKTWKKSK